MLPAGVPREIVAKLTSAIKKVVSTEDHKKRLAERRNREFAEFKSQ